MNEGEIKTNRGSWWWYVIFCVILAIIVMLVVDKRRGGQDFEPGISLEEQEELLRELRAEYEPDTLPQSQREKVIADLKANNSAPSRTTPAERENLLKDLSKMNR